MLPVSWPNGEYQQAQQHFQPSQSSPQLTQTSVGTYQSGTANNTPGFGQVNRGLSSQGTTFIYNNGIWQHAYMIRQVGNGHLVNNATAQGQVATLQHGHQKSVDNLSTQNISDTMRTNNTYCRQDMPAHVNQIVLSHGRQLLRVQNGNLMSNNGQQNMVQRSLHQNVNGILTVPLLAHKEGITSTSSPSASVQIRPITQSLNYSQSAQQRALFSTPQIRHNINQLSINRVATTNSLPNTQNYHTSNSSYINSGGVATSSINMNLKSQSAQQVGSFPIPKPKCNLLQLSKNEPVTTNTLPSKENYQNSGRSYVYGPGVVASSSRTNSNGSQYEANQVANPLAGAGQPILRQQSTNSGENTSLKVPYQTHNSSPYGSSQFVSKETRLESNLTMQPVVCSGAEICRSNPLIFAMLTEQSSAKNTSNMPTFQPSTDTLPQQSFASKNLSITPTAGGSGDTLNRDSVELKAQLSTEKEREMLAELEMLIRLYSNDNSIHSSGHTVPKAVAVVPPLSQKNTDTASESTSSIKQCSQSTEVDKSLPEGLKEGSLHLRDNCKTSPKTSDRSSKPSSTPVASTELPRSQNTHQKVVSISDGGPELSVNMEMNQRVVQACPSEVLTQNSATENSETPADPKLCAYDLSSIPTVQWTAKNLDNYISYLQLAENAKTTPESSDSLKILQMFWGSSIQNLRKFFFEKYKNIATSAVIYLRNHTNPNTVILSEVKDGFVKVLENYHALEHDKMYEGGFPYVSSWLNTNEKLDDIDKEFGFPMFLRTRRMSDSESQQDYTSINTNAEISNEAPNKSLSLMEIEPADSHKEESNTDEDSSKQCVSPTESSADNSDPNYSFAIQVLPPEEAKLIFEKNKIQLKEDRLPQKTTESCTKGDSSSIVKGSHTTTDISQMQQICCLTKWMETLIGQSSDFTSKCQCKADPADKDCTEGKFTSAKDAQVEENSDNSMTSSLPEIDNTFILNSDFLGADDTPQACEPSHDSMDSSNSSIIFLSENKDQEQVPNQMHNQGEDPELAPIESPGSSEYCTSEEIEKITEIVTSDDSSSEIDWDCIQPELESTDRPEPPMEEKGDTCTHAVAAVLPPTRPSKSKKDMRTAELVLFGSTSQGTHDSVGQSPSSVTLQDGAPRPPKILSVNIRPLKPTISETIQTDNYSVKRRIYEKWRRSLPLPAIRHNKANTHKKLSVHRASFMKAKMLSPTSTKNRSLNLDVHKQLRDQKKKGFLSFKKRRKSLLTKPTECQSHGVVDPHEDRVLGFNVLPKTFSFKDGSNCNSNTRDDVTEKTLLAEADHERSSNAVKRAREYADVPSFITTTISSSFASSYGLAHSHIHPAHADSTDSTSAHLHYRYMVSKTCEDVLSASSNYCPQNQRRLPRVSEEIQGEDADTHRCLT